MRVLIYEWKIHFSVLYIVPILVLAMLTYNLWINAQNPYFRPDIRDLHLVFEVFWPLVLALGFATIIPTEHDNCMLELRLSYPRLYVLSLLQKLGLPLAIWAVSGSLAAWFLHYHYLPLSFLGFVKLGLPPALFLSGLALFISCLTLSTTISFLVASAWWGWELISQCKRSGLLALLPFTTRLEATNNYLLINRYLISLVGVSFVILGTLYLSQRPIPTTEE